MHRLLTCTHKAMAWYCSGSTNTELIENLFKAGLIENERVKEAMIGVMCRSHYRN